MWSVADFPRLESISMRDFPPAVEPISMREVRGKQSGVWPSELEGEVNALERRNRSVEEPGSARGVPGGRMDPCAAERARGEI